MYMDIYWIAYYNPDTGEIITDGGRYRDLKNLNFAPQTDLTGTSMPVNEYTVDVITTDDIPVDVIACELHDDRNLLWAAFPIRKVVRISEKCLRLTCTSWIHRLQYKDMSETVYTGETAATVIADIFYPDANTYQISSSLQNVEIYGYAPAQTARDRLTWLMLVLCAHIKDTFTDRVQIKKTDVTSTLVPIDRTYMRPSVEINEWVTGVEVTAYTFSEAEDQESWEADDSHINFPYPWVCTERTISLSNSYAPSDAPVNVKKVNGVYFVTPTNAGAILVNMARYCFSRLSLTADIINNHKYSVGDLLEVYTARDTAFKGYLQQASYKFGHQAMSTVKLIGTVDLELGSLIISYVCNNKVIGKNEYNLPVGMEYNIENKYLDQTRDGRRRIYRPITAAVTGTMTGTVKRVNVQCELYLELYNGVLTIIGVDEITEQSSGGETIGVIA